MKTKSNRIDPLGFVLPLIFLIVWYSATASGRIPSYLLPSPERFLRFLVDFATGTAKLSPYSGTLMENLTASCIRVLCGFGIAAFFGLVSGFLTGRIRLIKRILDPTVNLIRAVPGIGWLPIAMVWFGVGEKTTVFLIALAAFFPIYINAAHGASEVPLLLIRAGRMLGANRIELFRSVILPSAIPSVVVGLRLGMGVSWAYLVLGELTGVSKGLGAVMMDSRMLGQIELIPVTMVCIAILGKLTDMLLLYFYCMIYPYNAGGVK
jgi:NitT/TauT family transport system permease protein